jgi:hypothetical protein
VSPTHESPSLFAAEEELAAEQERAAGEKKPVSNEKRLLDRDGTACERLYWDPLKDAIYVLISAHTRTEVSLAVTAQLNRATALRWGTGAVSAMHHRKMF